jgi:ABC-2 type transport system permease protein
VRKRWGFSVVMQLLLLPMLFLSGALFPLKGLPAWLAVITRVTLLAYDVDPLRHLVFELQNMPAVVAERFATGTVRAHHLASAHYQQVSRCVTASAGVP